MYADNLKNNTFWNCLYAYLPQARLFNVWRYNTTEEKQQIKKTLRS